MKMSVLTRRLLAGATVLTLTVVLWGCGQVAPTEVGMDQTLQSSSTPPPADSNPTDWW